MRTMATPSLLLLAVCATILACGREPAPAASADHAEPVPTPEQPTQPSAVAQPAQQAQPARQAPAADTEATREVTPEGAPAPAPVAQAEADEPGAVAEGSAQAASASKGPTSFRIASGEARFVIDAPLEKIKGRWTQLGGRVAVDPSDLRSTRGEVTVGVRSLVTDTFGNPGEGKDAKQNEHALNWMEVGSEVDAATRTKYSTARFTIESVDSASPQKLSAGNMTTKAKVRGKLTLHGKTSAQTATVEVTFEGPPDAPTGFTIKTVEPFKVSLKGHDIKPRDLAGRFLAGALEKVGQKIVDEAAVSLELKASRQ